MHSFAVPIVVALSAAAMVATSPSRARQTSAPADRSPALVRLSAGAAHACGLAADGTAWCWGEGAHGQLGDGTTLTRTTPVPVAGGHRFRLIAAGGAHTCGITGDGALLCWGINLNGELGAPDAGERCDGAPCSPRPVEVAPGAVFDTVVAGHTHSCAVAAGQAWCWGDGSHGRLGVRPTDDCGGIACAAAPVAVPLAAAVEQISVRGGHTCALADGSAWCWGDNRAGQLGAAVPDTLVPEPRRVAAGLDVREVSVGGRHTCVLTFDAAARCWGGAFGTTGPVEVASRVATLAVGGRGVCALLTNGELRCRESASGDVLTSVAGQTIEHIAVGGDFACALAGGRVLGAAAPPRAGEAWRPCPRPADLRIRTATQDDDARSAGE